MVGIQVRASEGLALTGVGGIALLGNPAEGHSHEALILAGQASPCW